MKVTIWDLDYYYAKEKVNCYNPDVMHISSYHKQCGDQVTFVLNEYDIRRPYDLYYIIKENKNTPNPPLDFFTNSKVRWWGNAVKVRVNWKMTPTMLGCRPDYLLYPEKNTAEERAEFIRLFDNQANLLPITQDYSNSFKRKDVILTDKYIWQSSKKSLLKGLDMVKEVKNLSFLEPIRLDIILNDKDIVNKILELNLTVKSKISFSPISYDMLDDALEFALKLKAKKVLIGPIIIKYDAEEHWKHFLKAYNDFNNIKTAIVKGRKVGIRVISTALNHRLDTPYYHLFEEFNNWTSKRVHMSWLEYLKWSHPKCNIAVPSTWDEGFRDLLRQTYTDKEFLLIKWKEKVISENEVPWKVLDEEFKYNI